MSNCPHCDQDLEAEEFLGAAQRLLKQRDAEIERLRSLNSDFARMITEGDESFSDEKWNTLCALAERICADDQPANK